MASHQVISEHPIEIFTGKEPFERQDTFDLLPAVSSSKAGFTVEMIRSPLIQQTGSPACERKVPCTSTGISTPGPLHRGHRWPDPGRPVAKGKFYNGFEVMLTERLDQVPFRKHVHRPLYRLLIH